MPLASIWILATAWLASDAGDAKRAPGTSNATCTGVLRNLPSGWVSLPQVSIDSTMGGYHDAVSGALVEYDGNRKWLFEKMMGPPTGEGIEGILDGMAYRLEYIPDARERLIERGRRLWGNEYPENVVVDDLPLSGAARLSVRFVGRTVGWWFKSDVYSGLQEERVRALLFNGGAAPCDAIPASGVRHAGGKISADAYSEIVEGNAVEDVLKRLGAPDLLRSTGEAGFVISYDIDEIDRLVPVHLYFDQDQRLVKKVAGPPGYPR